MSGCWTLVGALLTIAMVVLSALINYSFGYSLGTTEMNGRIFGAVSVIAVGVMAVLPLRISRHWDQRRKPTAIMGAVVFGILMAYAVGSSIGFGMQNRSQIASSAETLSAQLKDQVADRDQAASRLKNLAEDLPASAISTKIDAAKKDRRWTQTEGCTNVTAAASRDFCQTIDQLRGQLDVAAEATVLRDKIEKLNGSIEKLRNAGAGQNGDAQSVGLAMIFGTTQDTVRASLSILLALVIESVCCFGLLVIVGGAPVATDPVTVPEWVGRWLAERVSPDANANVTFSELERDFETWRESRRLPAIGAWRFRRLLRAACKEVGLQMSNYTVAGIRLVPGSARIAQIRG